MQTHAVQNGEREKDIVIASDVKLALIHFMMFDKNPLKTASLLLLSTLMTMVESGDI
jgi:hypothetical protein